MWLGGSADCHVILSWLLSGSRPSRRVAALLGIDAGAATNDGRQPFLRAAAQDGSHHAAAARSISDYIPDSAWRDLKYDGGEPGRTVHGLPSELSTQVYLRAALLIIEHHLYVRDVEVFCPPRQAPESFVFPGEAHSWQDCVDMYCVALCCFWLLGNSTLEIIICILYFQKSVGRIRQRLWCCMMLLWLLGQMVIFRRIRHCLCMVLMLLL
jgi:hypothetical protein